MRINPYRTVENVIAGVVITFAELTDQKKNKEELSKLILAVEQSSSGVMITDSDGFIEYVNPKFSQVSGYSAKVVMGKAPRILKSGKHPRNYYEQMWKTIKNGQEWHGEFHNKTKSGKLFWESVSISPLCNSDGAITHFVAVREDITDRKEAEENLRRKYDEMEEEIKRRTSELVESNRRLEQEAVEREQAKKEIIQSQEALKRSNELIERAFCTIHVMIAHLDSRLCFLKINQRYVDFFGYTEESFQGRKYFDLFPDREKQQIFKRVIDSGTPHFIFARPHEHQGQVHFLDWTLQPVIDDQNKTTGLLITIIDVTEREKSLANETEKKND